MFIVDGADLVGKSHLCRRALERLNARWGLPHMLMHLSRPPATFDALRGYVDKMSTHTVWDRFHLGELAYRQLDDYPSAMTPWKLDLVEARVRLVGGFSVVVYAEEATLRHNYAERGDDMYSLDHILSVNRVFAEMCSTGRCSMRHAHYRFHVDGVIRVSGDYDKSDRALDALVDAYAKRLYEMGLA